MVSVGLLVSIEAKPDRADEFADRLGSVVEIVRAEGKAVVWFGLRLGPTTFAIYDAFANDEDRQAHLDANLGALLKAGEELFTGPPTVQRIDVVASLVPGE
ncbi:MAG TPA: antibiotic biosynthesis monooxygenase [Dactylosporangium sp.]|jgi:quinol monooxygenase YgiN|nr:antibiotic biosynthesis monooxygenase [Dactylosporangium sp.]